MGGMRLYLHDQDHTGIFVTRDDGRLIIDWFGSTYELPAPAPVRAEAVLNWARKACACTEQELSALGSTTVINPFTNRLETYSHRGGQPKAFGRSEITGSTATLLSASAFTSTISGSIIEITHKLAPAWGLLTMGSENLRQVLNEHFLDYDSIGLLLRGDVSAPVVAGNLNALTRMSEEIPHPHKVVQVHQLLQQEQGG